MNLTNEVPGKDVDEPNPADIHAGKKWQYSDGNTHFLLYIFLFKKNSYLWSLFFADIKLINEEPGKDIDKPNPANIPAGKTCSAELSLFYKPCPRTAGTCTDIINLQLKFTFWHLN